MFEKKSHKTGKKSKGVPFSVVSLVLQMQEQVLVLPLNRLVEVTC